MVDQRFVQADGDAPRALLDVRWPGERGIGVGRYRFVGGARVSILSDNHVIFTQPHALGGVRCRLGDRRMRHEAGPWNITLVPAGTAAEATADCDVDSLVLRIPAVAVATAVADQSRTGVGLVGTMSGTDGRLRGIVSSILREAARGRPGGAASRSFLTDELVDHLCGRYASAPTGARRGVIAGADLRRIREFVLDHMQEPIRVGDLARLVGCDEHHFARLFGRSTGLTPHRYVMRMRVRRALDAIRVERLGAAQAALLAGFSDQSHLANWVRRCHGATVTELTRAGGGAV